ncbi:MAG: cytochrome c3 family protein [Acidobacteriota bacterium]|nr:MAG: cytochrome c3 family protein [Acidobacteriota bacterium]
MKHFAKISVVLVFAATAVIFVAGSASPSGAWDAIAASVLATPTPPPGTKKIPKSYTLSKDSLSEYGDVAFDHDTHAFGLYSPDGKSQIACVECHHTDQPKSALKPPLVTSERNEILTWETFQKSDQKVTGCRDCHFQDGAVPDDKEMPTADYTEGGKKVTKDLNNELAYHINCNTCHDEAAKLRPEVKKTKGFATSKDCLICHLKN